MAQKGRKAATCSASFRSWSTAMPIPSCSKSSSKARPATKDIAAASSANLHPTGQKSSSSDWSIPRPSTETPTPARRQRRAALTVPTFAGLVQAVFRNPGLQPVGCPQGTRPFQGREPPPGIKILPSTHAKTSIPSHAGAANSSAGRQAFIPVAHAPRRRESALRAARAGAANSRSPRARPSPG